MHSLALLRSGSGDDSRGGGTGPSVLGSGSRGGRRRTSVAAYLSEGRGVLFFAPSLALTKFCRPWL